MGICRRRRGSEYYARRFTPKIPHVASSVSGSPSRGNQKSQPSKVSPGIYPRVVDQGHCSGGNRAHSSVLLENVYCSKEKREEKAHFGFVPSEQVDFHSPVQDGNSRENSKANNFSHVGDIGGYNRCLPACSYSSGVPDLFCISPRTQDLCVSGHAIRSNNSSMGFFQGSETHKVFSASSGSNDFLLSGRLSDSCFVVPFSKDSYQMDIGCPGMAGVHSEPREVVSCPSPETGVSGHYVEPSEAFSLPPEKVEKILSLCQEGLTSSWLTRRELERLVGFLNFATKALSLGRLYLIPLISWMNNHTTVVDRDLPVPLDLNLKESFGPWLNRSSWSSLFL